MAMTLELTLPLMHIMYLRKSDDSFISSISMSLSRYKRNFILVRGPEISTWLHEQNTLLKDINFNLLIHE